ncbi:excalibur calcium-binding domain-containing protein [Actinoplanes sp. NPDC049596]|uniref:excalibur calcium-binding domain-containing protein n=1 Tax=unclassified Actinoplanes TaxID=2626549 RepID=UPI003446E1A0
MNPPPAQDPWSSHGAVPPDRQPPTAPGYDPAAVPPPPPGYGPSAAPPPPGYGSPAAPPPAGGEPPFTSTPPGYGRPVPGYVQPGQGWGQPASHGAAMDAYGQPVDAYGQPVEGYDPSSGGSPVPGFGPPTAPYPVGPGIAPPKPPSRWKTWHKVTLGAIGALSLCFCGVAIFAPDSNSGDPAQPEQTNAAQRVAGAPSTPAAEPTTTAPATAPVTTVPAAVEPTTPAPATTKPSPSRKPAAKPTTTKAVYYATCDDAPGPLRTGQPGYRKALDRDGDGVACEQGGGDEEPPAEDPGDDDSGGGGTDPRYSSCTKAKAAGYGPYYEGTDPEYDWYSDRDNDGVVCE